jgi:hypothetical protein
MANAKDAIKQTLALPPQTQVEILAGLKLRRNRGSLPIVSLHYSAHPDRSNIEWKTRERKKYSSQGAWDREQEIRDDAGGGELVFADTLITHWNVIVITDPRWRPHPAWKVGGGFDHGKTNATAFERTYVDYDSNIYFCGEYYQPGLEVFENAPHILKMPDLNRIECCWGDPTIFPQVMQQAQNNGPLKSGPERAKSINDLYVEQGITCLAPFSGDRSDISFAGRLMLHWSNLDQRKPSVYIVCRNYADRPQPGLHPWDCPNLLWELMRARRVKLTATQLMGKNPAEALVDKDNHARDAAKYFIMSLPEPTIKTHTQIIKERLESQQLDLTSASIRAAQYKDELEVSSQPATFGRRRPWGRR